MKIGSVALALMISLAGTAARSQEVSEYGSTSRGRLPDSTTRFVAQDLIRQLGVDCQVSAALALGRDGNGIPQYEVACADGPGYILVGSSGAINCLGLTARSSSEGRRSPRRHQCRLPGNRNPVLMFSRMAHDAGLDCRVDEGALVGVSANGRPIYEIGCSRAAGGWIELTPMGWQLADCMTLEAQGNACRFTNQAELLTAFRNRMPPDAVAECNPVRARFMGSGTSGAFYEAACGDGRKVVVSFNGAGSFDEIIPCEEARQIGDGCRLERATPNHPRP